MKALILAAMMVAQVTSSPASDVPKKISKAAKAEQAAAEAAAKAVEDAKAAEAMKAVELEYGVAGRGPLRPVTINEELSVQPMGGDTWVVVHAKPWAANSLLARMPDGTIVLCDTPYDDAATAQLIAWVRKVFGAEVKIVAINSHFHTDAMGGNGALKAAGVPSYGSKLSAQMLNERGAKLKTQLLSHLADQPELQVRFTDALWLPPAEQFDPTQGMELTFGTEKVVLFYPGPGHSPDNIVTWFPQRQVLFGGCLVQAGQRIANDVDADLEAWPRSIDKLRTFQARTIVPGHGRAGGPELLDHTNELVAAHVKGKTNP